MKKFVFLVSTLLFSTLSLAQVIVLSPGESVRVTSENIGSRVSCGGVSPRHDRDSLELIVEKQGYYYYMVNARTRLRIGSAGHGEPTHLELATKNVVDGMVCSHNGSWKIFNAFTGSLMQNIPYNQKLTHQLDECIKALYEFVHPSNNRPRR